MQKWTENPCITNYSHNDGFLSRLNSSIGTNVLNLNVQSMALSGTDFQCIILNREVQKALHCRPAKSALSRKTHVGVWLHGS